LPQFNQKRLIKWLLCFEYCGRTFLLLSHLCFSADKKKKETESEAPFGVIESHLQKQQ